jgi:hypothetical protein
MKHDYQIIDKCGSIVAIAEILSDAIYAAKLYDAKHIYDKTLDRYIPWA